MLPDAGGRPRGGRGSRSSARRKVFLRRRLGVGAVAAAIVVGIAAVTVGRSSGSHRVPASAPAPAPAPTSTTTTTLNVYANAAVGKFSPAVQGVPSRVYVPNSESDTVSVIDPTTFKIISTFPVPRRPQHVVPSWDLKTLYVNSDLGNALTPIDPRTGT